MDADHGSQNFDSVSWWPLGSWRSGPLAASASSPTRAAGFIVLGAVMLVVGVVSLVGVLASRHLEISDVGATTRRFFHWSRTYPRSDIQRVAADWSLFRFSMPLLGFKSGRQVRLWLVSRPTLWPFRTSKYTAEIVEAINPNRSLAYRADSAN